MAANLTAIHPCVKYTIPNATSLLFGLGSLALLVLARIYLRNKPVALFIVIGAIVIASMTDLASRGVKILGAVSQGVPPFRLPAVAMSDLNELLPLAMACFLLAAVETVAIGRMFALKHGYRLDPNQEFLALAAANVAAGLGQGFPVSGGMSQSLVNETGGARTPLSGLVAALAILLVALTLSGLLRNLPQPVLGAIVLMAVAGLFDVNELKQLWRFSRAEFAVAVVAMLGVLGSGILRGVLIGAALSLVLLLRRGARPHTTELGRVHGTDYFADCVRHPENEVVPDVFVFRCDAALLFFNVDYVRDRFFELLSRRGEGIRLTIFFLGTTPTIDLAGTKMLAELRDALQDRDIAFRLAEAHGDVRDTLVRAGYVDQGGRVQANQTVATVLASWRLAVSASQSIVRSTQ